MGRFLHVSTISHLHPAAEARRSPHELVSEEMQRCQRSKHALSTFPRARRTPLPASSFTCVVKTVAATRSQTSAHRADTASCKAKSCRRGRDYSHEHEKRWPDRSPQERMPSTGKFIQADIAAVSSRHVPRHALAAPHLDWNPSPSSLSESSEIQETLFRKVPLFGPGLSGTNFGSETAWRNFISTQVLKYCFCPLGYRGFA